MEKKERNCLPPHKCAQTFGLKLYEVHYFPMFCSIYLSFRSGEKKKVTFKKKEKEINSYICKGKQKSLGRKPELKKRKKVGSISI